MAKTIAQQSSSDAAARNELVAILLSNTNTKTEGSPVREIIADMAANTLDSAAVIAGAFTGAWGNAKQAFTLEANYRAAEREVRKVTLAERYADRLLALRKQ